MIEPHFPSILHNPNYTVEMSTHIIGNRLTESLRAALDANRPFLMYGSLNGDKIVWQECYFPDETTLDEAPCLFAAIANQLVEIDVLDCSVWGAVFDDASKFVELLCIDINTATVVKIST